jgi:hypothetical protein
VQEYSNYMDTEGDPEEEEGITEEFETQPLVDNVVMIEEIHQSKLDDATSGK